VAYCSFIGNANDSSGMGNNAISNNATLTTDLPGYGNTHIFLVWAIVVRLQLLTETLINKDFYNILRDFYKTHQPSRKLQFERVSKI
jgi:hypothetical protein